MRKTGLITLLPGFLGPEGAVANRNFFDVLRFVHLRHWYGDYGMRFEFEMSFRHDTGIELPRNPYWKRRSKFGDLDFHYNPFVQLYTDDLCFAMHSKKSEDEVVITPMAQFFQMRTASSSRLCFPTRPPNWCGW